MSNDVHLAMSRLLIYNREEHTVIFGTRINWLGSGFPPGLRFPPVMGLNREMILHLCSVCCQIKASQNIRCCEHLLEKSAQTGELLSIVFKYKYFRNIYKIVFGIPLMEQIRLLVENRSPPL